MTFKDDILIQISDFFKYSLSDDFFIDAYLSVFTVYQSLSVLDCAVPKFHDNNAPFYFGYSDFLGYNPIMIYLS